MNEKSETPKTPDKKPANFEQPTTEPMTPLPQPKLTPAQESNDAVRGAIEDADKERRDDRDERRLAREAEKAQRVKETQVR